MESVRTDPSAKGRLRLRSRGVAEDDLECALQLCRRAELDDLGPIWRSRRSRTTAAAAGSPRARWSSARARTPAVAVGTRKQLLGLLETALAYEKVREPGARIHAAPARSALLDDLESASKFAFGVVEASARDERLRAAAAAEAHHRQLAALMRRLVQQPIPLAHLRFGHRRRSGHSTARRTWQTIVPSGALGLSSPAVGLDDEPGASEFLDVMT